MCVGGVYEIIIFAVEFNWELLSGVLNWVKIIRLIACLLKYINIYCDTFE